MTLSLLTIVFDHSSTQFAVERLTFMTEFDRIDAEFTKKSNDMRRDEKRRKMVQSERTLDEASFLIELVHVHADQCCSHQR